MLAGGGLAEGWGRKRMLPLEASFLPSMATAWSPVVFVNIVQTFWFVSIYQKQGEKVFLSVITSAMKKGRWCQYFHLSFCIFMDLFYT